MKTGIAIGPYVLGRLDQLGIPPKVIQSKSRLHPSTFSRFINGINGVKDVQLLEIGIAIGEARVEAQRAGVKDHAAKK